MAVQKPFFVAPEDLTFHATGNEVAGTPASMLGREDAIGLVWKSNGAANLWVRGQFAGGASRAINFCSLILANALPGTTIRLRLGTSQAQVDGASAPYDSGAVAFINPAITRDDGLYHSHLELGTLQNATWWRIDIGGHTGDFQGSTLVLGKKVSTAKFYDFDYQFGVEDTGKAEYNRFGVMDQQTGVIMRTVGFTLNWMTQAEWETLFRPLVERVGTSRPVYLCFDGDPTVYRQAKSYLGIMKKAPFATGKRNPKFYGGEYQILSVI